MTLKDILISGKLTISEGGGGGGGITPDMTAMHNYEGEISLTDATEIKPLAYNGSSITSISGPQVAHIGYGAFTDCTQLEHVSFPLVETAGDATDNHLFRGAPIDVLNLPSLKTINGNYTFGGIGKAAKKVIIVMPKVENVVQNCFRNSFIAACDLGPNLARMTPNYVFWSGALDVLILRRTADVVAASANGIGGVGGSTKVYVPSALIDSYKAATAWSSKGDIFYPIEGSIYENAYADGTPIA